MRHKSQVKTNSTITNWDVKQTQRKKEARFYMQRREVSINMKTERNELLSRCIHTGNQIRNEQIGN